MSAKVYLSVFAMVIIPCSSLMHACRQKHVGELRLVEKIAFPRKPGYVEMCWFSEGHYHWLPVCNNFNSWDGTAATFVCQKLNFNTTLAGEFINLS